MLNKVFYIVLLSVVTISCNTCYECSTNLTSGVKVTEETCGRGKGFKDDVKNLSDVGWSCIEK